MTPDDMQMAAGAKADGDWLIRRGGRSLPPGCSTSSPRPSASRSGWRQSDQRWTLSVCPGTYLTQYKRC